jgi:MFS family permease
LRLALAALAMSAAGSALTVNLVPVLSSTGLGRGIAVSLAGLSGVSAILGRVIGGILLDRYNARLVGGVAVLLPMATSAILLSAPGQVSLAVLAVLLSGLASGAEMDAIAYLAGRSFGLRKFGLLFGTLSGLLALGIGMGPTLANFVYDQTHSYEMVIWAIIPLSALTSLMFVTVPPYPIFNKAEANDDDT